MLRIALALMALQTRRIKNNGKSFHRESRSNGHLLAHRTKDAWIATFMTGTWKVTNTMRGVRYQKKTDADHRAEGRKHLYKAMPLLPTLFGMVGEHK